ncbi:MAG TPA: S8 family serine peptidase [Erysipelotrichaceae bacterium]|nr:S8 family serine peptidase [Erysipelotrichaceae bacterium]
MRKIKLLGLTVTALVLGSLAALPNNINQVVEKNDARIIVKFNLSPREYSHSQIIDYQNQAISTIKNFIAPSAEVCDRYTNLINGVVLNIPSSKVNAVRGLSFVSALDYDTLHHIEQGDGGLTVRRAIEDDVVIDDNISEETMNVPDNTRKGEGILVGILDAGFLLNHKDEETDAFYTHETYSPLDESVKTKYSSAEEIDAIVATEGFHGEAVTVESLYFNNKVPYYYDYGGSVYNYDDYAENTNVVPDNDVFSPMSDHGLHVSSMAVGNGPTYKGIAPNAQVALFKVFTEYYATPEEKKEGRSDSSGCFDSAVIKALEDAAILDCDVLNMSFGSDLNDFDDDSIVHTLLAELRENGIWSNYAAGNSGKGYYTGTCYGGWSTDIVETGILSGSANLDSVMTVAANQADRQYYTQAIEIDGKYISYTDQVISRSGTTYDPERYLTDFITPGERKSWVKVPNFGELADYEGLDVTDKVAIVDRGSSTFADKVDQAHTHGARAICIINNSSDPVYMSFGDDSDGNPVTPAIPVALIAYEDRALFDAGEGELTLVSNVYVNNITARQMTTFSSDGATFDYLIKPEISAPGHLVKGAVSQNDAGEVIATATDTYDYWSGTSMSAPNYTGAMALLLGEHTENVDGKLVVNEGYIKSINARTMSTADQMDDKYGLDASVRIQGAGMVNVAAALDSEVYLEGVANSGKSKIELGNNVDIAEGNLKLSFVAHNEGEAKTYNAKVKVYRPTIYRYERRENSKESLAINNVELQAITNTLIAEVDFTINVPNGESTINLDTISLDEATKQYIDEHFEAACPIEGYVVLTNDEETRLSIPFLGYYGDVTKGLAVEPFNFEKEPGKLYPSALVNNVMRIMGFDKGDFSSDMAVGYFSHDFFKDDEEEEEEEEDTSPSPLYDWIFNKGDLTSIKGSNNFAFSKINSYRNPDGSYAIYTQNNEKINTIFVQQYVMRSVKDNYLTITKKSNNEVMTNDHMFDTLWGDDDNHTLAKSFCLDKYLSNGITGHRAYTILGLFNQETDENYPDGEYELKFEYILTDGSRQVKTYDLVIDNASPTISSVTARGNYIRVRFDGTAMNTVKVGSSTILNAQRDEIGYYVDINESEVKNGRIFFAGTSLIGRNVNAIAHFDDPDGLIVSNLALTTANDFVVSKSVDENTLSYTISYKRNGKPANINGNIFITLNIPEGYDPNKVKVLDYNKEEVATEIPFTVYNQSIRFQTQASRFDIVLGDMVTLDSLQVTAPDKTIYAVNEELDLTGLLVVGRYTDNNTRELYGYELSDVDMSSAGNKEIVVSFQGKTARFNVTVVEESISALVIASLPYKTAYAIGENLDLTGFVLKSITNTNKVTEVTDYSVSDVDTSTPGSKIVTVTSGELSVSFAITVLRASVSSITITKMGKTTYEEGEALDLSGFEFTANYSDGTTEVITDYRVIGFNRNKVGKQTILINYGGKNATFEVMVGNESQSSSSSSMPSSSSVEPSSSSIEPSSSSVEPSSSSALSSSTSSSSIESSTSISITSSSSSVGSSQSSTNNKSGCGGSMTMSVVVVTFAVVLGISYTIVKSKKEQ